MLSLRTTSDIFKVSWYIVLDLYILVNHHDSNPYTGVGNSMKHFVTVVSPFQLRMLILHYQALRKVERAVWGQLFFFLKSVIYLQHIYLMYLVVWIRLCMQCSRWSFVIALCPSCSECCPSLTIKTVNTLEVTVLANVSYEVGHNITCNENKNLWKFITWPSRLSNQDTRSDKTKNFNRAHLLSDLHKTLSEWLFLGDGNFFQQAKV